MSNKLREATYRDGGCIGGLINVLRPRMRPGESMIDAVQRMLVLEALQRCHFHQGDAAALLGMTPPSLSRRCHKYWPEGTYDTASRRGVARHGLRRVG